MITGSKASALLFIMKYQLLLFLSFYQCLVSANSRLWRGTLKRDTYNADLAVARSNSSLYGFGKRAISGVADGSSTCGFLNGDPDSPRTAAPGFDCRFDRTHNLWGFCPTSVIAATDCGLAGNCVDSHACKSGCGIFGTTGVTTFTCGTTGDAFCSTVLVSALTTDVYSYIACGPFAALDRLQATPTTTASATLSSTLAAAPASSTSPSTASSTTISPSTSQSPSPSSSASSSARSTTSNNDNTKLSTSDTSSSATSTPESYTSRATSVSNPSSSATDGSTSSSSPSNLGAIIGGIVGGLAILCFFTLGVLFLRRYNRRDQDLNGKSWWRSNRETTKMQTAGLHEIAGDKPPELFETAGYNIHEKMGSVPDKVDEGEGKWKRKKTAFELPS